MQIFSLITVVFVITFLFFKYSSFLRFDVNFFEEIRLWTFSNVFKIFLFPLIEFYGNDQYFISKEF